MDKMDDLYIISESINISYEQVSLNPVITDVNQSCSFVIQLLTREI